MKIRISFFGVAAAFLVSEAASAGVKEYRTALELYDRCVYESAWNLFSRERGELPEAYAALCALKLDMVQAEDGARRYLSDYPKSSLAPLVRFELGNEAFDKGLYCQALDWYLQVPAKSISEEFRTELLFNTAYCHYDAENYREAVKGFTEVEKVVSDFRTPARYYLGYIEYCSSHPEAAAAWLEQVLFDPRFARLSAFYLLECRFLLKDYDYVLNTGEIIIPDVPAGAKSSIYRMMSESSLVKGDTKKAAEYLELEQQEGRKMSRADYFHAGSVMYSVKNYRRAVEYFSKMSVRTDSLGQIANYQMGYACVKTGNKVRALEAFNDAAKCTYNPEIREDACFNYAKLAFDLNHDPNGFRAYMDLYSTSRKGDAIYGYMALSELYLRDYASAVDYFGRIDKLDELQKKNFVKANYLRAKQLCDAGAYSDAVSCLKMTSYYLPKSDRLGQLSRYQLGETCYKAGKYDQARTAWTELYNNSALARTEEGASLQYNIAYTYFMQSNFISASRWFDNYLADRNAGFRTDALLRRIDCDYYRRDYNSAIKSCQAAASETESVYPIYIQAVCQGLLGKKKDKLKSLQSVSGRDKSDPYYADALYELGRTYIDLGKNGDAVLIFEQLKSIGPDNSYLAKAMLGEGMAYRNMGDYDHALEQYKAVVAQMPESEYEQDALPAIESLYQAQHHPEKYLQYIESIKLISDKSPEEKSDIYFTTAEQLYLAGNYEQAEEYLKKYLDNSPGHSKNGEAMFYLADAQKTQGKKEQALNSFEQAVTLLEEGSFREQARLNVAALYFGLERYEKAFSAYSDLYRRAQIDQNRELAAIGMLQSAYKAKKYDELISFADIIATPDAYYLKAKALLALSRREEALAIFEILSKDPTTPQGAEASVILIQDKYERGQFDAIPDIVFAFAKKCKTQSYWLAKAYLLLGDSYAEKGNFAQAKATFESVRNGYDGDDDILPGVQMRLDKIEELNK